MRFNHRRRKVLHIGGGGGGGGARLRILVGGGARGNQTVRWMLTDRRAPPPHTHTQPPAFNQCQIMTFLIIKLII